MRNMAGSTGGKVVANPDPGAKLLRTGSRGKVAADLDPGELECGSG